VGLIGAWVPGLGYTGLVVPNLAPSSRGRHDATFAGTNLPTWRASSKGPGIDFDGDGTNGGYLAIDDGDNFQIETPDGSAVSECTLCVWLKPDNIGPGDMRIFVKANGVQEADHVFMLSYASTDGQVRWRLKAGGSTSTQVANSGEGAPEGLWTHLAFRYDGAEMRIYVNGVQSGSISKTGTIDNTLVRGTAIARNGGDPYGEYNGMIDDVRVYTRALAESEIKAMAAHPLRMFELRSRTLAVAPPAGAALVQVINEVEEISETVEQHLAMTRMMNEVVEIVETTVRPRTMVRLVDEIEQIVEATNRVLGTVQIVNEVIQIVEATNRVLGTVQIVNEVIEIVETTLRLRAMVRLVNETVEIVEQIQASRAMTRVIDETVEIPETTAIKLGIIGAGPVVNVDVVLADLNVDVILPASNIGVSI
jgi:hypothetical protein